LLFCDWALTFGDQPQKEEVGALGGGGGSLIWQTTNAATAA